MTHEAHVCAICGFVYSSKYMRHPLKRAEECESKHPTADMYSLEGIGFEANRKAAAWSSHGDVFPATVKIRRGNEVLSYRLCDDRMKTRLV